MTTAFASSSNAPLLSLQPDEVLVHVMAVAINPCDYKMHERFPCPGAVDGCDFAGVIVALGSDVTKWSIGDTSLRGRPRLKSSPARVRRLCRLHTVRIRVHTQDPRPICRFEEAAALGGTGLATLGMALFKELALPGTLEEPATKPRTVLVHGGSSSVGTMAMQLVRLASPSVLRLWAVPVAAMPAWRCTQTTSSSANPSRWGFIMGPSLLGHRLALSYGYERDEDPEMRAFGVQWYRSVQKMLDQGKLRPHPLRILATALKRVLEGVDMLKRKAVSGEKLVVALG
ncbi:Trans-enoyl reductase ccsC [Metarhizium anisopliae]|nr:Trans-enoyl reductase ccsC [Metarhizium anisopliae]